jgi:hypothetical protein
LLERISASEDLLKMAEAPTSKKRRRGNPNQKTGLIGVYKMRKKYQAMIRYCMVAEPILLVHSTQKNKLALPTIDSSLIKARKRSPSH